MLHNVQYSQMHVLSSFAANNLCSSLPEAPISSSFGHLWWHSLPFCRFLVPLSVLLNFLFWCLVYALAVCSKIFIAASLPLRVPWVSHLVCYAWSFTLGGGFMPLVLAVGISVCLHCLLLVVVLPQMVHLKKQWTLCHHCYDMYNQDKYLLLWYIEECRIWFVLIIA